MEDEKSRPREAPDYFINTAPEMDALERAAADGKHGRHYTSNEQLGAVQHTVPGSTHSVWLELTIDERIAGATTAALEQLSNEQDADASLAFLYIARVLAPPNSAPELASGTIDFDDVIAKIGWDPRSSTERRDMHKRIYQFVRFGERAQVVGQRRGTYRDKHTGEIIPTNIRSSIWRIHKTETPEQTSLFPNDEFPVRVQLVVSPDWTALLTSPQTAQYLPLGEQLGAIPGNKPSGAWARVIGLSLANFWRRNPRESLDGTIKPSRRELLERFPPKTGAVDEILKGNTPRRAMSYWHEALQILLQIGFLQNEGELLVTPESMKEKYPRQGWSEHWLSELVDLRPGPLMRLHVEGRATSRTIAVPLRKRGRPRKVKTE